MKRMNSKWNGWIERETDHEGIEVRWFWIARWTRLDFLYPMRLLKSKNSHVWKWNGWSGKRNGWQENETDHAAVEIRRFWLAHWACLVILCPMRLLTSCFKSETDGQNVKRTARQWNGSCSHGDRPILSSALNSSRSPQSNAPIEIKK